VTGLRATAVGFAGALVIELPAYADDRGLFKETYVRTKYRSLGIDDEFVQDSVSYSGRGVLRGLHADPRMSKLVQVLHGTAFDVIADARAGSPTFGCWQGFALSADDHRQLYVPTGFLHGFVALTDDVVFSYKQGAQYDPTREIGVRWDDPVLNIEWPAIEPLRISGKDRANLSFIEAFGGAQCNAS